MNNREIAGLALNSIRYRSLRSWLAILGIVIGVASIISLISISVGLNSQIQGSLGGLGANVITITAGAPRAERFGFGAGAPPGGGGGGSGSQAAHITFRDADSLRTLQGVSEIDARVQGNARVSYRNKNTSVTVIGTEPAAFPASAAATISIGRGFGTSDTSSVVLGNAVATQTFNDSMLNKQIKINGQPFRVVGILNASGSSFGGPDRDIFITQRAAKNLFNQTQYASSIVALAAAGSNPDDVAAGLTAELQQLHRVTNTTQDFTVTTASSLQSTISSITGTLGIFLGGIASISLIVGGIGVANAMFTSVLEQTKYIGLLKSLGARNTTVLKLFLFEACLVGMVGGLLGIVLSFAGSAILENFGLPSQITPDLILLGMGFSIVIGAVSGLIPARNAASIAPVEALRYE
jgi:putative ABC transport system permease protein